VLPPVVVGDGARIGAADDDDDEEEESAVRDGMEVADGVFGKMTGDLLGETGAEVDFLFERYDVVFESLPTADSLSDGSQS
jgi:hypothetical protein